MVLGSVTLSAGLRDPWRPLGQDLPFPGLLPDTAFAALGTYGDRSAGAPGVTMGQHAGRGLRAAHEHFSPAWRRTSSRGGNSSGRPCANTSAWRPQERSPGKRENHHLDRCPAVDHSFCAPSLLTVPLLGINLHVPGLTLHVPCQHPAVRARGAHRHGPGQGVPG